MIKDFRDVNRSTVTIINNLKREFTEKKLVKLFALVAIFCIIGCSDDVGVGPKGKLYFYNSSSWKDSGLLIYENFDPECTVPYHYSTKKDSVYLRPCLSGDPITWKAYPKLDLDKFIFFLEGDIEFAVSKHN